MGESDRGVNSSAPLDTPTPEARQESERILFIGAKRALIGGLLAGGVAVIGQYLVGRIYTDTEARRLLEAMMPSARSVGTGVVTASATTLALMLTMLSLSRHTASELEATFFIQIRRIGLLSTTALIASVLLLLMLSIPLQETENLPASWYSTVYYVFITLTAGVTGLLVAIVLMLYNAMQSLIAVLHTDLKTRSSQPRKESDPGA